MRSIGWSLWDARRRPAEVAAVLACGIYVAVIVGTVSGHGGRYTLLALPLPLLTLPVIALRRTPLSRTTSTAVTAALITFAAFTSGVIILNGGLTVVIAVPGLAIAGAIATR